MKNINLLFLLFLTTTLLTCKDDDDDCIKYEICESCEEVVGYQNYSVDFFSTHKDYKIKNAEFETVTEQVLIKESHNEGAIFQTVTEQIQVHQSYTRYEIMDSMKLYIVVDAAKDSIGEITCYHFYDEDEIIETEVPSQYTTLIREQVLQQGSGEIVPAIYSIVEKKVLVSDAELIENTDDQVFKEVDLNIPDNRSIRDYLADQFSNQSSVQCLEGNSYKINE